VFGTSCRIRLQHKHRLDVTLCSLIEASALWNGDQRARLLPVLVPLDRYMRDATRLWPTNPIATFCENLRLCGAGGDGGVPDLARPLPRVAEARAHAQEAWRMLSGIRNVGEIMNLRPRSRV
jgi:hypothetical protein